MRLIRQIPRGILWTLIAFIFFTLGALVGIGYAANLSTGTKISRPIYSRNSGFKYTNPLLDCEISDDTIRQPVHIIRDRTTDLISELVTEKQLKTVSVYYRDLFGGPWFGLNEDLDFSPASLLKVPLLIGTLQLAESDPSVLSRLISVTADDMEDTQNIKPGHSLAPGKQYTVESLLGYLINDSSNNAIMPILELIGNERLEVIYKDLNIPHDTGNVNTYTLEVRQYAGLFRVLFNASYLSPDMSEKALQLLSESDYENGLVAGVPSGINVAHKFGERYFEETGIRQLHDCGIVYHPGRPYLLCIMTQGDDLNKLEQSIARISEEVYNQVNIQVRQISQ